MYNLRLDAMRLRRATLGMLAEALEALPPKTSGKRSTTTGSVSGAL